MIVFQALLNYDPVKEILKIYFNEESDYSEENTSGNEDFCSTILQSSQFDPEQTKKHGLGPWERNYRSSGCSQIFFKIDVLKNFANFTGKHLRWNLFLITLQVLKPSGRKLYYKKTSTQVFSSDILEILNAFNLAGRTYMSWRIFLSDLMLNMYVLKQFSKIRWVD